MTMNKSHPPSQKTSKILSFAASSVAQADHTQSRPTVSLALLSLAFLLTPQLGLAANQTWTNAPVDANWNNTNNWIGRALPGGLNMTGNTVNNDVATFNSPIVSGIGGAANPILTDDA